MDATATPSVAAADGTIRLVIFRVAEEWTKPGGRVLRSSSLGERAFHRVCAQLPPANTQEPEMLVFDFVGIDAITVPYANESLVRLLTEPRNRQLDFVVTNANEDVELTLDAAIALARKRTMWAVSRSAGRVLGGRGRALARAVDAVVSRKRFTAAELAEDLGLSVEAANYHLVRIERAGGLSRRAVKLPGGGREFEYQVHDLSFIAAVHADNEMYWRDWRSADFS